MASHDRTHDYVITFDLGQRIQELQASGLVVPAVDHPLIESAERRLIETLKATVNDGKVIGLRTSELAKDIIAAALEEWPDAFIVSACPELKTARSAQLEVSRLYGLRGKFEGVGPRPGYPSLLEQAASLKDEVGSRPVVIVDDGVFTGVTIEHIVDRLKAKGIRPVGFVAGFAFARSQPVLDQAERGGVRVKMVHQLNPVAWHPHRDFVPFIPGCGRVIGFTMDGRWRTNRFPLYTHNGASYAFPYLPQFSDSAQLWTSWAGLPDSAAEPIGSSCLQLATDLYLEIERLNSRPITIGDVSRPLGSANVPMIVGESDFPPLQTRVVDYLSTLA